MINHKQKYKWKEEDIMKIQTVASVIQSNMSDAARLYEVVFKLVSDALPEMRVEHQITLSQMITGVLRAGNVQFHQIARKLPRQKVEFNL